MGENSTLCFSESKIEKEIKNYYKFKFPFLMISLVLSANEFTLVIAEILSLIL